MAHYTRMQVLNQMTETGLVPLFYHKDVETGIKLLEACYKGGARTIEFTNRGDFAHLVFSELSQYAVKHFPGLILGVGSINDAATAALYMQLGSNFIVSASLRDDVALVCNRRKVPYMPGCGSLTEIGHAEELGCEIVKLFPGSVYGPKFIKAIKGPQRWTTIMPTGGVSPNRDNLKSWFDAGAHCVGMGSQLILKKDDGSYDYEKITSLTAKSLQIIKELRAQ